MFKSSLQISHKSLQTSFFVKGSMWLRHKTLPLGRVDVPATISVHFSAASSPNPILSWLECRRWQMDQSLFRKDCRRLGECEQLLDWTFSLLIGHIKRSKLETENIVNDDVQWTLQTSVTTTVTHRAEFLSKRFDTVTVKHDVAIISTSIRQNSYLRHQRTRTEQ